MTSIRTAHIRLATAVLVLVASLSSVATSVQAGDFYAGLKAGIVDPQANGYDATTTAAAQLAYEFAGLGLADIAVEGEIARSLTDGEGPVGDYNYQHNSVFAALRTAGPLYLIARVGLIDATIETSSGKISDDGAVYGLGLGFSTGLRWELEWTSYEFANSDTNLLSLSLSF